MAPKLKEDSYGKLFATERLDVTVPHSDGYDLAFTFNEGEEIPRELAEKAGLLKGQKRSSEASKEPQPSSDEAKDTAKTEEPRTAVMPAPRRRRGKKERR